MFCNSTCDRGFYSWILGDHQVKVAIKAVGICGSDVHYYKVKINLKDCVFKTR
jgi:threonine dehydrogenase-like Zn-dependent dehydrogenase